jgi:hypothetical protein
MLDPERSAIRLKSEEAHRPTQHERTDRPTGLPGAGTVAWNGWDYIRRLSSKIAGLPGPSRQFSRIFQHVDGNFVIVVERLCGVGPEWLHPACTIAR